MNKVEAVLQEMQAHLDSGCACCQMKDFTGRLRHAVEKYIHKVDAVQATPVPQYDRRDGKEV